MGVATFADGQLTDALKHLAGGGGVDPKVRRKVISVLASWHSQFKSDPSMAVVAGLLKECRATERSVTETTQNLNEMGLVDTKELERKKAEKEAAKKAKKDKEKAKREEARKKREREQASKNSRFVLAKVRIKALAHINYIAHLQVLGKTASPKLHCQCITSL